MKSILRVVGCLVAGSVMAMAASQAQAQRPAHYYPARPTFSPYFLYRQVNTTGIPNYYSFVEPAKQYRDFMVRRPTTARRTESLIGDSKTVARLIERELRERPSTGIGAAAVPARYGDYGHFYSTPTPGRR
jgi:hypothetical protein